MFLLDIEGNYSIIESSVRRHKATYTIFYFLSSGCQQLQPDVQSDCFFLKFWVEYDFNRN